MSDDAQVFVGAYYCDGIGLSSTPATWNASGSLLSPPLSETRGLSADGLVLVGSDGGHAALKQGTQVTPLGPLPGGSSSSVALDASADGARIVGRAETVQGPVAFVWDAGEGMRAIAGLIEPPLVGWTLEEAVAISADGMIIAGNGVNPDGHAEGWVVDLTPSVPIGDTGVLVAALVALLVGSGLLAMRRSSA
jgi:uncharacterized membrane protein